MVLDKVKRVNSLQLQHRTNDLACVRRLLQQSGIYSARKTVIRAAESTSRYIHQARRVFYNL